MVNCVVADFVAFYGLQDNPFADSINPAYFYNIKNHREVMMRMLGISEDPQEDEGDALAIAICHLHNRSGIVALAPKDL